MQRARRVAVVAVLAVLGALALAGCRSQPGVAYYIGDAKVSESRIDQLARDAKAKVDDYNRKLVDEQGPQAQLLPVPGGDDIVAALVTREVVRRVADELDARPESSGSPQGPQSEYNRADAETVAYLNAIAVSMQDSRPPAPSDDDLRATFDRAVALRIVGPGDFAQFKQEILQSPNVPLVFAVRAKVMAAAARYRVTVNPRYQPAEFPLLRVRDPEGRPSVLLGLPMGSVGVRG